MSVTPLFCQPACPENTNHNITTGASSAKCSGTTTATTAAATADPVVPRVLSPCESLESLESDDEISFGVPIGVAPNAPRLVKASVPSRRDRSGCVKIPTFTGLHLEDKKHSPVIARRRLAV